MTDTPTPAPLSEETVRQWLDLLLVEASGRAIVNTLDTDDQIRLCEAILSARAEIAELRELLGGVRVTLEKLSRGAAYPAEYFAQHEMEKIDAALSPKGGDGRSDGS